MEKIEKKQENGPRCLTENSVEDKLTFLICADLVLLAKTQPANNNL